MSQVSRAAGLAALSVCESLLLSLTDSGLIDEAAAKEIFAAAAAARRKAALLADGAADDHAEAADLLERILHDGDTVRLYRPTPPLDGDGHDPQTTAGSLPGIFPV